MMFYWMDEGNFSLVSHTFYVNSNLNRHRTLLTCIQNWIEIPQCEGKLCPHSVWGSRQNSAPLSNLLIFRLDKIIMSDIQ